jgi:hypothetical protein
MIYTEIERKDTCAMRQLIDDVIGDYESSKVTVVAIIFVATRRSVNTGFGLDEWVTARRSASHAWHWIIGVAVVWRSVSERRRSYWRIILLVG